MPTVIECDPDSPVLDVSEPVDIKREPFFADLERLYRRSSVLPAVLGRVVGGQVKVIQRADYIEWARMLGRRIRVVLSGGLQGIDQIGPQVQVISAEELRQEEERMFQEPAWQIYRFVRPLSAAEQEEFVKIVDSAISVTGRMKLFSAVDFFDHDQAAEFLAFVPPYDDESRRALQASFLRFSLEAVKIVAFNGNYFMPTRPNTTSGKEESRD